MEEEGGRREKIVCTTLQLIPSLTSSSSFTHNANGDSCSNDEATEHIGWVVLVIGDARERRKEGQEEGHQHRKQLETRALVEDRNTRYIQLSEGREGRGVVHVGYTGEDDVLKYI